MPKILIVFGTTDGHTRKIAESIASSIRQIGSSADIINARYIRFPLDIERYDGVIVAASVHIGSYQRPVVKWVKMNAHALSLRRTAFVSVCLGVLEHKPEVNAELNRMLNKFFAITNWCPSVTQIVAGAIVYTRYGFLKRCVMRRIARKTGGGTDTTRDYEYTDWDALDSFARSFVAGLRTGAQGQTLRASSGR